MITKIISSHYNIGKNNPNSGGKWGFKKGVRSNIDGEFKKGEKAKNWNGFKKGYHPSPETIKKMSNSHSGKNNLNWVDGYKQERWNSKIRGLGFEPLNKKNKISNTMHHLSDGETVVFEPKEFHDACNHRGKFSKGKNRKMADAIALMWYSIEWFYKHGIEV